MTETVEFLEGLYGKFECEIIEYRGGESSGAGYYNASLPGKVFVNIDRCKTDAVYAITLVHEYTHLMQHEHKKFFSTTCESYSSLLLARSIKLRRENYKATYGENPMECDAVLASLFIFWQRAKSKGILENWKNVAKLFMKQQDISMMTQLAECLRRETLGIDKEKHEYAECCYDVLADLT